MQNNQFINSLASKLEEIKSVLRKIEEASEIINAKHVLPFIIRINNIIDRYDQYLSVLSQNNENLNLIDIDVWEIANNTYKTLITNSDIPKAKQPILQCDNTEYSSIIIPSCLPIMKQVICQIIDNAIKYSAPSDCIKIKSEDYVLDDTNRRKIVFTNIGPQVEEQDIDDIFEFEIRGDYASKLAPQKGYGIGLYLADLIIQTHKWLDAYIYATSDERTVYNKDDIPYSEFSIIIDFCQEPSSLSLIDKDNNTIERVFEKIIRHELAGSVSNLFSNTLDALNSSKNLSNDFSLSIYELYCIIAHFYIFLYKNNIKGRPYEIKDISTYKEIRKNVNWTYKYKHRIEKQIIEERKTRNPFLVIPLYLEYCIFCHLIAEHLTNPNEEIHIQIYDDCLEFYSTDTDFSISNEQMSLINDMLSVNKLSITFNNELFTLKKQIQ